MKAGDEFGKRKTRTGEQRGAGREKDLELVGGLQKQFGGSGAMSCSWQGQACSLWMGRLTENCLSRAVLSASLCRGSEQGREMKLRKCSAHQLSTQAHSAETFPSEGMATGR